MNYKSNILSDQAVRRLITGKSGYQRSPTQLHTKSNHLRIRSAVREVGLKAAVFKTGLAAKLSQWDPIPDRYLIKVAA
jgi:hypothetical protein